MDKRSELWTSWAISALFWGTSAARRAKEQSQGMWEHVGPWCPPTSEPLGQDTRHGARALGALMNPVWEIPFLSPALCGVSQLLRLLFLFLGSWGW